MDAESSTLCDAALLFGWPVVNIASRLSVNVLIAAFWLSGDYAITRERMPMWMINKRDRQRESLQEKRGC